MRRPRVYARCRFRFQCGTGGFSRRFFGFNWDWNLAPVPIETKNSAPSGENGLSLKCGYPAPHILVGDLLLPRKDSSRLKAVSSESVRSESPKKSLAQHVSALCCGAGVG